jgi:hypothetical protein
MIIDGLELKLWVKVIVIKQPVPGELPVLIMTEPAVSVPLIETVPPVPSAPPPGLAVGAAPVTKMCSEIVKSPFSSRL